MASQMDSFKDSVLKNLDLTLELEIPIPLPPESCSSSPSISVTLDGIHLPISEQRQPISPPSPSDLEGTSSSHWQGTTGDQVP